MILIADSGSTKTDWALVENGKAVKELRTKGMNPFQMSEEEIAEEVRTSLIEQMQTNEVDEVHFYGAGCTKECEGVLLSVNKNYRHLKAGRFSCL